MNIAPTILWFRNDLRLADNAALSAAVELGFPIVPVFIWDPASNGAWAPGAASQWWLHHALNSLNKSFCKLGGSLIFRKGDTLEVLEGLIRETGAKHVFWNRRYESSLRELDVRCKRVLTNVGLNVRSFNSALLNEPHEVSAKSGSPYKVYTPYFNTVVSRPAVPPIALNESAIRFPQTAPESNSINAFELLPSSNWDKEFERKWEVTEEAAQKCLRDFLDQSVDRYQYDRDRPDRRGTSVLSPYLHFGQIGPRQIVQSLKEKSDLSLEGPHVYLKEIYWREFAYHVLYHFPKTPDMPLQSKYANFPWKYDATLQERWEQGKTGYPVIDAGMRQLWETGWMHNRVRMIVASFLVKHLLQDWKQGAQWFWDTLVDADLASNTLGWQWSGGCGADAAPYFRVFNPIIQGKKFDPDGSYVKRFVPELAKLPVKYIHTPWEAPTPTLNDAGVTLDVDYPKPIVDHAEGRARALSAFAVFKAE